MRAKGIRGQREQLEWLEYESGYGIQVTELEQIQQNCVTLLADKLETLPDE